MTQENKDILVPLGMSLRDWFAGQALVVACDYMKNHDGAAEFAYAQADAMLKARKQACKE